MLFCSQCLWGGVLKSVYADDVMSNPDPDIDIVVSMPKDYPGTFLDFKAELEEKLIAEGLDPDVFRIVDSTVKIDTTDTSSWYVYDHYYDQTEYNKLGVDAAKQPYRAADNTHTTGQLTTIEKEFATTVPAKCMNFVRHIASSRDEAGKAKMIFAGYGTQPYADYMLYPAASDSRRTFSFDMDAKRIDTHTLTGAGFFMNAGIAGSNLNGYLLWYSFSSATGGSVQLKKVVNQPANMATANITSTTNKTIKSATFNLGTSKKARIDVDLRANQVTIQQRNYDASGNLGEAVTLFDGPVSLEYTGQNGFGPVVGYKSHGCSSLSSFEFSDLEMAYEADAFEALRNIQYSEDAEYKYFINLAGTNNDPSIPEDDELYLEGIERLNNNEIFYVSNADDGRVLTEPDSDSSGIGPDNGLYATNSDYVGQMAEFIADKYKNGEHYKKVELEQKREKPLADFIIVSDEASTKGEQVLTIHLQHLNKSGNKFTVKIEDKSVAQENAEITGYRLKIYDPDNNVVAGSDEWHDSPDKLAEYTFDKDSAQGRYVFELTVKDSEGKESNIYQTFLTAYLDDQPPEVSGVNQSQKSEAKITIEDTGWGIDEDGVTLIENQGSGVQRYQINGGEIVKLDSEKHQISVTAPLTKDDLTITAWDECNNEIQKVFPTAEISFKDGSYDSYYVLKSNKLMGLPEGPESDDENEYFKGWQDQDGNLVGPDTVVTKDLILEPLYVKEKVTLTFDAKGGSFGDSSASQSIEVPKGSLVIDHLLTGEDLPEREGYKFKEWKLNGAAVSNQAADGNLTLTAEWEINQYVINFDPNGGVQGRLKSKAADYGSSVQEAVTNDEAGNPYQGTSFPTREGYTFSGWARDPQGTAIGNMTMPSSDITVYAQWKKDDARYIVSFDTAGGNRINDVSYPVTQATYGKLPAPSRQGYAFGGWYDADGTLRESNGVVFAAKDHTLTAKWTANDDTQYRIEYYLKTDDGYKRDNDLTAVRKGTTDSSVSLEDGDILDIDGYWYNASHPENVSGITISGDGKAAIKLYYDRLFDVTTDGDSHVEISGSVTDIKEGESPQVTWAPEEGYYISKVYVDGEVRDDLLDAGKIVFDDISADHEVRVDSEKIGSGQQPGSKEFFTVRTKLTGAGSDATITGTASVIKGGDHRVEWSIPDDYVVKDVLLDGKSQKTDNAYINLKSVNTDHEIEVVVEKIPKAHGQQTDGYYTVTVNRYGGNDKDTFVSDTFVSKPGEDGSVLWSASGKYSIDRILVDGRALTEKEIEKGSHDFNEISANHVVDVYFKTKGESLPGTGDNEGYFVNCKIEGAAGKITSGGVVEAGSDYTVKWQPELTVGEDPSDDGYARYRIDRVEVNGEAVETTGDSLTLKDISENKNVVVYVVPDTYTVTVTAYGPGKTSGSKTLYKGQDYEDITAVPDDGNVIMEVWIDGEKVFDIANPEGSASGSGKSGVSYDIAEVLANMDVTDISEDHTIYVVYSASAETEVPSDEDLIHVTAEFKNGTGTVSGTGCFDKGSDTELTWNIDSGYVVKDVKVNGESVAFADGRLDLSDLSEDKHVEIILAVKGADGDDVIPGGDENQGGAPGSSGDTFDIITSITGGPGTISAGAAVEKGDDREIEWSTEAGYEVRDVIIDGVSHKELTDDPSYIFENIQSDHEIEIVIGKTVDIDVDVDGDGIPDVNIDTDDDGLPDVNIDLDGDNKPEINIDTDNTGKWAPSGSGGNGDGIWKPDTAIDTNGDGKGDSQHRRPAVDKDGDGVDDSWKPDRDVFPDGIEKPGYDTIDSGVKPDGELVKSVVNKTDDGEPNPDDILEYEIIAKNKLPGSMWQNVVIKDKLPKGVELIESSLVLKDPSGVTRTLGEGDYTFENGILTVPIGMVMGNEEYVLNFQVRIRTDVVEEIENGDEAAADLTNTAVGEGSYGEDKDGDNIGDGSYDVDSNPAVPEGGGTIVPYDPDVDINKTAENLSREDGRTHVDDKLAYAIEVENKMEGSVWKDVAIRDRLKEGVKLVPGSVKLIDPDGKITNLSDDVYDEAANVIAVYVGNVFGGEKYTLTFEVTVTADALGHDIGNVGEAVGGKPGSALPDDDHGAGGGSGKPGADNGYETGDPYHPEGGGRWDEIDKGSGNPGGSGSSGGGQTEIGDDIYTETGEAVYPFPGDKPDTDGPVDDEHPDWVDDPADPDDGGIIPADPEPEITKDVIPEVPRENGTVQDQDILTYEVTLSNPKAGSLWKDVFIYDYLPDELVLDPDNIELVHPDGSVEKMSAEEVYDPVERSLEVPIAKLYGGEKYTLRYKVTVRLPGGEEDNDAGIAITNEAGVGGDPDLTPETEVTVYTDFSNPLEKMIKTGDPMSIWLFVILMAGSAGGIAVVRRKRADS